MTAQRQTARGKRGRPFKYANFQHPPCPGCDKPVVRRRDEPMHAWAGRRCCSLSCSAKVSGRAQAIAAKQKFERAERAHPPCIQCRGPILHRKGESLERFVERQTCTDPECRRLYHRRRAIEAGDQRRGLGQAHTPHEEVLRETRPVSFGGNFGLYDVREPPSLGRLPPPPQPMTYAGVVRYGR